MKLSRKEIATEVFGVDPSNISRWAKRGMPKEKDGTYDVLKCVTWALDEAKQAGDTPETKESQKWLTAFRKERALMAKIERQKVEGELISRGDIIAQWVARVSEIRNGLLALSDRLTHLLTGKPEKEVRQIIYDECWDLLDRYSRNGKYTPQTDAVKKATRKPKTKRAKK